MKCPDCGTEMKPLAFSMYCPNDCDRKVQQEIDPEKTPLMIRYKNPTVSSVVRGKDDDDLENWWDGLNWDTD